ncbi:MAG: heavy metal translocating P-type ATPase [Candidatus Edwardsbacteria bacterium]|nr:heavy metal translocating P-type ATPase [Candidatus Edwardsbacteria bacterium]
MKTITLPLSGLHCASCAGNVEGALRAAPGIASVSVNLATERATVEYDGAITSVAQIVDAVRVAGYDVPLETATVAVAGMHCASCVLNVEHALQGSNGVVSASVNLATERATVSYIPGGIGPDGIRRAIVDAGYDAPAEAASDPQAAAGQSAQELERARLYRWTKRRFLVALAFAVPVFLGGMHMVFRFLPHWLADPRLLLLLATPVQFFSGWPFYRGLAASIRRRSADMDVLVAVGTTAAYGYSTAVTLFPAAAAGAGLPPATYFDSSAVIITLVLMGRLLEARAKGRTSQAIRRLVGLQARTARVLRDGAEAELPVARVAPGDLIVVRPGETVATDGAVVDGHSAVDEAMVTGESMPAEKRPGDAVIGGTVNRTGTFTFRATAVGAATVLAQIIRLVEQAQGSKAPIQRLADRVAAVFVPVVMGVAALTFLVWLALGTFNQALVNAVAVLIIACPCALGLATPTAIMVGTGRGAERGILVRGGDVLERARTVDAVVFDKTGTLTTGRVAVTNIANIAVASGCDEQRLLRYAGAAEAGSEHPVGRAIAGYAAARRTGPADVRDFAAQPGFGVAATVDGTRVLLGTRQLLEGNGVDGGELRKLVDRLRQEGKTTVLVAIDGAFAGVIAVADTIKASAPAAVARLHAMGLRVMMITGDHGAVADAIAAQLGIDQVLAEVPPQDKAERISRLQRQGLVVAMVGDGINDAPALAQADVGIAMGAGTDVAIESADIILVGEDLGLVADALRLSRATLRTIKQNLFWAFIYNVIGIPVAAGALYPVFGILLNPMIGAAAMAFSSVSVIANSLRLRQWR